MKGRMRSDPHRWRGPGTVIATESPGRYYLGWRGRILLVARDQLRLATAEETAAADLITQDATLTANEHAKKAYHDMTDLCERPAEAPLKKDHFETCGKIQKSEIQVQVIEAHARPVGRHRRETCDTRHVAGIRNSRAS